MFHLIIAHLMFPSDSSNYFGDVSGQIQKATEYPNCGGSRSRNPKQPHWKLGHRTPPLDGEVGCYDDAANVTGL